VLVPLILAVIFLVVAVLLQALVAPLVLVVTTALSFGASFGLSNLLWRNVLGYAGIEAQLPLYVFVFLVALGVDYNIFLSARVREEARDIGTRRGTLRGLSVTGGVAHHSTRVRSTESDGPMSHAPGPQLGYDRHKPEPDRTRQPWN
jgi:RND superfamily putative drug exporter